jgi:predicted RNase H-like nuclease (RuvC/YqgF family)
MIIGIDIGVTGAIALLDETGALLAPRRQRPADA